MKTSDEQTVETNSSDKTIQYIQNLILIFVDYYDSLCVEVYLVALIFTNKY